MVLFALIHYTDALQHPLNWTVGSTTDSPQEVTTNPADLQQLHSEASSNAEQHQQQQQQEEEGEKEEMTATAAASLSRTTLWSDNNPVQVVKFNYF